MIEMIKERLQFSVQQTIIDIDKAVKAIEKALEKRFVLRDEVPTASALGNDPFCGEEQASADAQTVLLMIIREELLLEKEKDRRLLQGLDGLLYSIDGHKGGYITEASLLQQAEYCEAEAKRLSVNTDKITSKVRSIFSDEHIIEETSEILRYVDDYETTSRELMKLCHEASDTFRKMRSSDALGGPFEGGAQKEDTAGQKQEIVPPSVGASDRLATVLCGQQNEKTRQTEKRPRKGLFGLFGGRKKKAGYSSRKQISPPPNVGNVLLSSVASDRSTFPSSDEYILPPPGIDSVQFSAVAPNQVVPGKYLPINIVMYEDAFRKAVDDIIRSHGDAAKESKGGYQDVERDAWIKVILTSPDVTVEDGVEERRWSGKYLDFEFVVKIPSDFAEEQILFVATVYINDLIATKLKLILDCDQKSKRSIRVTREDIVSAFVSYASQDRSRVAAIIQGMKKARPDMDIFFDIESLRSGQKWEEALKSEISRRDILFLCWSKFAKDSKWVDMEWRYALESKGEDCIEPIPIDSPDVCPPPIELQQKHFNDKMLYIIQATAHTEGGRPCLIRVKTGECMVIDKALVRIGKQREYVDLFIGDNAAISRSHANIIEREGHYYIVDTNSVNHTYVNGERIPDNVETIIHFGTRIRLADEEFEFVCR